MICHFSRYRTNMSKSVLTVLLLSNGRVSDFIIVQSESESFSVMFDSLWPHGLYSPWNSPGQNTDVGSLSLLQGIFPTQKSNPGPPHCRQILFQLSHKGSPRILELVAYPFSSGSSQPRNLNRVSCIAGRFFTNWAIVAFKEHWIIVGPAWITCPSHWMEKIIINESPPGSHGVRKRSQKEREPPHQEKGERKEGGEWKTPAARADYK